MSSFNDIPTELVAEIVGICAQTIIGQRNAKADLCDLRLVSRFINNLATPILFSHLTLNFKAYGQPRRELYNLYRCQNIVEALASGTTKAFEQTKSLSFSPAGIYSSDTGYNERIVRSVIKEKLQAAVLALKSLKSVVFRTSERADPPEVFTFLQTIGVHSQLRSMSCRISIYRHSTQPEVSFSNLSNLRALELDWGQQKADFHTQLSDLFTRCPDLERLSLCRGITFTKDVSHTKLGELFAGLDETKQTLTLKRMSLDGIHIPREDFRSAIRHFQHLQFLEIKDASSTLGEICSELKASKIWLKGLVVKFVDDPLICDYLTSYSGLEYLELQDRRRDSGEDLSSAVNRAYKQLIPHHNATLTHLIIGQQKGAYGTWSAPLTCDQVKEVVKCKKLKLLRIYWCDRTPEKCITIITPWLEIALQLPKLERLFVVPIVGLCTYTGDPTSEDMYNICVDVLNKFTRKHQELIKFFFETWSIVDREEASYYFDIIGTADEREEREREREKMWRWVNRRIM